MVIAINIFVVLLSTACVGIILCAIDWLFDNQIKK